MIFCSKPFLLACEKIVVELGQMKEGALFFFTFLFISFESVVEWEKQAVASTTTTARAHLLGRRGPWNESRYLRSLLFTVTKLQGQF